MTVATKAAPGIRCPNCAAEISQQQLKSLIYAREGTRDLTCERCGQAFPVLKRETHAPVSTDPTRCRTCGVVAPFHAGWCHHYTVEAALR